jgi:hypothetical protein
MPHDRSHTRKKTPKRVLALPDLDHAKSAVLSSLTSRSGQRTYDHAQRACYDPPVMAIAGAVAFTPPAS